MDDLLNHCVVGEAQVQGGVGVRFSEQQVQGFEAVEGEPVAGDPNREDRGGGSEFG
jgi:hypothetical protein